MKAVLAVCYLASLMVLTSCGGGGDGGGGNPPAPSLNVTGNWEFASTSQVVQGGQVELVGYLTNSGNSVTAHVRTVSNCLSIEDLLTFTGTVHNGQITFTSAPVAGQTLTIQAQLTNTSVNGTYSISGGCADGDHGNITGFKVNSFSGNWSGRFISSSETFTDVTATVTQGTEEPGYLGVSRATGTVTFSNSPCFTSGTFSAGEGFVFGVNFVAFIHTDDGGIIQFTAYSDNNVTRIDGGYEIQGGNCDGDVGVGSITRH